MGEEKNITERQVEFAQMIHDRKERRKDIAIILLAVALIITIVSGFVTVYYVNKHNTNKMAEMNAKWIEAWQSYDYVGEESERVVTYSQDGEGVNNINTGNQGDINNGASSNN